jgi:hypothetical protein
MPLNSPRFQGAPKDHALTGINFALTVSILASVAWGKFGKVFPNLQAHSGRFVPSRVVLSLPLFLFKPALYLNPIMGQ